MNKRIFSVMGILALLIALVPMAVSAAPDLPDYKPVDVGPELREWEPTLDRISGAPDDLDMDAAMAAAAGTSYYDCILGAKWWLSLNDYTGYYFWDVFYLVAETAGAELWVQQDLSYPAGDPRPTPVVTCEQAAYLLGEFDNNMYPTETAFFGEPDFHDGSYQLLDPDPDYYSNEAGRQVVLVSNVRDDNYYDPTYPNYIAGFYSPTFEYYFDRNIMSIDSYAWEERVGPDGSRPYLYESVFAHEYQHLLHDDYDGDEENFINEGLSMFAEFLTGYVVGNDAYSTFEELPENSLTAWGDQGGREIVADYGLVFLYQMYLYEKFGQEFIQYEFHNQDNGITSINSTLDAFNIQKDFGDTYHDLSVAVLVDDTKYKGGRYGFENLDVAIDIGTSGDPNPDAYDTPGAPPWGADYIWIEGNPKDLGKLTFNGLDLTQYPTPWTSDGNVLWGGEGDLVDNWAIFETTGGGTLTFDTMYQIEEQWDFGFVQVSTDGGNTWTSLTNSYTAPVLNPDTHPNIIANAEGLTGDSGGWVNMSFDLSAYSGTIMIGFRYMTDWAFNETGWYIDNVYVDSTPISDGTDASVFKDLSELFPINNNFTVTFVGMKGKSFKVHSIKLNEVTEDGIFELNKVLKWSTQAVMIVTFDAPEGFTGYADYTYSFTPNKGPKK